MPVFKKQVQGGDGEKKDGELNDDINKEQMTMNYEHYDMGMMVDYDDLMPDPMQFVTLMGAPPPPPSGPPPAEHDKDILPPGIDESEVDSVPKPISDAPIPRKGPLPKDFQEALNIIFPGEKKPEDEISEKTNSIPTEPAKKLEPSQIEAPVPEEMSLDANSLPADEASQHSLGEAFLGFPPAPIAAPVAYPDITQDVPDLASLVGAVPPPPPPPPPNPVEDDTNEGKTSADKSGEKKENRENVSPPNGNIRRQEELDDLAMLGIDADDLAAQCM